MSFYRRIFNKYDRSFLLVYSVQYANASTKFMMSMAAMDMLKNEFGLDPAATQLFITF